MALDVYIQPSPEMPPNRDTGEHIVSIEGHGRGENAGYYWFLYPLFKDLTKQTGQHIDLYGNAVFGGDTLDALEKTLALAHLLVDAQLDNWEVRTGIRIKPMVQEVYAVIDKQEMNILLAKLEGAVRQAKSTGAYVSFFGD